MRAAIYVRLSKDTEATTSPERQRLACERLCAERGWDVVQVEEDLDVSASKRRLDRPGLDRLRAEFPRLDAVVYWKTDRLARSLLDYAALLQEADRHGVALVSATEPLDLSTPLGRAMAQVIAIFAEMEARTIGDRMRSTIGHLRETGRSPGGLLPWHLRRVRNPDGAGWIDVLHEDRAELLREASDRVIAGESVLAVARSFTARGVPTVRGGASWNPDTLRRLLRNPALCGYVVHRGRTVRSEDGLPLASRPAVLTAERFRELQRALGARSRPGSRSPSGASGLLAGLLVCGECGEPLYGAGAGAYSCPGPGRGKPCPSVAISRPLLDAYISEEFLSRFGAFVEVQEVPASTPDLRALEDTRAALADLEDDRYSRGLFPGDEGARRFVALHGRLLARLDTLERASVPVPAERRLTGRTVSEAWAAGGEPERRGMLESAIATISVRKGTKGPHGIAPERVSIGWRGLKV